MADLEMIYVSLLIKYFQQIGLLLCLWVARIFSEKRWFAMTNIHANQWECEEIPTRESWKH